MTTIFGRRFRALFALSFATIAVATASADTPTPGQGKAAHACALLSQADVKKYAPWPASLDQMQPEENLLANGSSCTYPSVEIQVMTISEKGFQSMLAAVKSPVERISGVGDDAYLRDNRGNYAELYARVGAFVFTTQHSLEPLQGRTMQAVKPEVIALGQALAATLR